MDAANLLIIPSYTWSEPTRYTSLVIPNTIHSQKNRLNHKREGCACLLCALPKFPPQSVRLGPALHLCGPRRAPRPTHTHSRSTAALMPSPRCPQPAWPTLACLCLVVSAYPAHVPLPIPCLYPASQCTGLDVKSCQLETDWGFLLRSLVGQARLIRCFVLLAVDRNP